ncbi:MAG: hypothetical protein J3Q66DRAFT_326845 [Benniella sp.]|nr:MAG: hypothetical protein J3Q66DRAFT_326845 [Benniella sp.]
MCTAEADVCIANALHTDQRRYVVSRDSYMFFHPSARRILRPYGRWFLSYQRTEVLRSLGLNETQMQLYAVVSGSDYAKNVKRRADGPVQEPRVHQDTSSEPKSGRDAPEVSHGPSMDGHHSFNVHLCQYDRDLPSGWKCRLGYPGHCDIST